MRWPFCRHRHYRLERRALHGVQVMHLVCDCGRAVEVLKRDADEHQWVTRQRPSFESLKAVRAGPRAHSCWGPAGYGHACPCTPEECDARARANQLRADLVALRSLVGV